MKSKIILLFSLLILFSCKKGPTTSELKLQIDQKLAKSFTENLFEITKLKRRGSYSYSENGPKLLIYFKAKIKLLKDYKFNNWNKIGQSSLISVLGSTASGIIGINPEGNKKGDIISVYGSNNYLAQNDGWIQTPFLKETKTAGIKKNKFISEIDEEEKLNEKHLPKAQQYLKKLKVLVKEIKKHPHELASIQNDLKKLLIKAQIMSDSKKYKYTIASGPEGGEYHLLAKAMQDQLSVKKLKYKGMETFGSLHNISLVLEGKMKFGIAQGDLLRQKNKSDLKAIMALFPEVIQIITLKSTGLISVRDLIGKKVNLGALGSGTRSNALRVLNAHHINTSDILSSDYSLKQSLQLLKEKKLDAIFFTGAYPTKSILSFSKKNPIHLLKQDSKALEILQKVPANLKLIIPQNIYLGQEEAYPTTGTTAIIFTHKSTSDKDVNFFLKSLFEKQKYMTKTSSKAGDFSKSTWKKGVEIEVHPAALDFF